MRSPAVAPLWDHLPRRAFSFNAEPYQPRKILCELVNGITDRVVAGLDEMESDAKAFARRVQKQTENVFYEAVGSVIDYAARSVRNMAIDALKNTLDDFMSSKPRVY